MILPNPGRRHPCNDAETMLLSYLEMNRNAFRPKVPDEWLFLGPADYFLKNGWFFDPNDDVRAPHGIPGFCFANAYRLARRLPERYLYAEGYAVSSAGHVHSHAWCCTPRSQAYDPSWTAHGAGGIGSAYFGVVFTLEFLAKHKRKYKVAVPVVENWKADYPILSRRRRRL